MRTLELERRILDVSALPKPIPFEMGLQVPVVPESDEREVLGLRDGS